MNNFNISQLKIDFLKTQLIGNYRTKMTKNKKGEELEKVFRYLITQPENGGANIKNLEDNELLFNYSKIKRSFEITMVGIVSVKEKEGSTNFKSEGSNENSNRYECELKKYDFYNQKEIVELEYEKIQIKYNIKKMKFIKSKKYEKFIGIDLCSDIKNFSKKNANSLKSGANIFKKAESIMQKDKEVKEVFKTQLKQKNITEEEYINYLAKVISFSEFIKENFNSVQLGYPNIITFSELKNTNAYVFHLILRRELDGAYKVLNDYNFEELSKMEEFKINENKKPIFKKDDILLFEMKDSSIEFIGLQCINSNFEVINGYVKVLKKKDEFKNYSFYYILIQENKEIKDQSLYSNLINEINKKVNDSLDNLSVKFYLFNEGKIFNTNFRKIDSKHLETLYLLKDELSFIKSKFMRIDQKFEDIDKKFGCVDKKMECLDYKLNILLGILCVFFIGNFMCFIYLFSKK